jgi:hypothetical protein
MSECSYHYEHIKCAKQARYFIRLDGRNDPICEWHSDPKFWPKEAQRNLSGTANRDSR